MVSLIPDPPTKELTDFCQVNQIQNIHFPVKKYKEDVVFNPTTVAQILHVRYAFQLIVTNSDPNYSTLLSYVHSLFGWRQ
jgi:hypothetical protein